MKRRHVIGLTITLVLVAAGAFGVYWLVRGPRIPEKSWLAVHVDADMPGRTGSPRVPGRDAELGYLELCRTLRIAAGDPRVSGVLLHLDDRGVAPHRVGEMARSIQSLRQNGKQVVVFARRFSLASWVLASHGDSISLHPIGRVDVREPRMMVPFFGEALKKAGLRADLIRVGDDKAVHEQFTAAGPSAELEGRLRDLHRRRWAAIREQTNNQRKSAGTITRVAQEDGSFGAQRALEDKWVDIVEDGHEFQRRILDENDGTLISTADYGKVSPEHGNLDEDPAIAVLCVDGILLDGASRELPFLGRIQGLDTLRAAIQEILDDESIRGVIVRIDSAGGDILASDEIWRELDRLQNELPAVALLGSQATSGGYYAALACEQIYCRPETITGAIGVLGGRVVARDLLTELGVSPFIVGEDRGGAPSRWEEYRATDRAVIQGEIQARYETFLARLRRGRAMDPHRAHELATGRLFLGPEALAHHLVDGTGGWSQAWATICDLADIEEPARASAAMFPRPRAWWNRLVEGELTESPLAALESITVLGQERVWYLGPVLEWN